MLGVLSKLNKMRKRQRKGDVKIESGKRKNKNKKYRTQNKGWEGDQGRGAQNIGHISTCNVGETGSIPGSGRSPEEGNGNPFQCSCLENFMERGV